MMMIVEQSVEWELAGKNVPQCHFVHHKSDLSSSQVLRGGKPETNRLSYGTAFIFNFVWNGLVPSSFPALLYVYTRTFWSPHACYVLRPSHALHLDAIIQIFGKSKNYWAHFLRPFTSVILSASVHIPQDPTLKHPRPENAFYLTWMVKLIRSGDLSGGRTSTIFWDITLCSPLNRPTFALFPLSRWFLARLILRPYK
jgi:hypothetical protein